MAFWGQATHEDNVEQCQEEAQPPRVVREGVARWAVPGGRSCAAPEGCQVPMCAQCHSTSGAEPSTKFIGRGFLPSSAELGGGGK